MPAKIHTQGRVIAYCGKIVPAVTVVLVEALATRLVRSLIRQRVYFQALPLPGAEWEVSVKAESVSLIRQSVQTVGGQ